MDRGRCLGPSVVTGATADSVASQNHPLAEVHRGTQQAMSTKQPRRGMVLGRGGDDIDSTQGAIIQPIRSHLPVLPFEQPPVEGIAGGMRALTRRRDGESLKICLTGGRSQASCRQFFGRLKNDRQDREQSPLVSMPARATSDPGVFQIETDGLCSFCH